MEKNEEILAYRILDEQAVVVDLIRGTLNTLNATATQIWQLVEKLSARQIAERIAQEFEIPLHEALNDVEETIKKMVSIGWLKSFSNQSKYEEYKEIEKPSNGKGVFEALREQAIKNKIPLAVHLDLTYRCPLRCVHCYLIGGKKRFECSLDEIKSILDQIADAGCLYLTLSGGEIFMRNDLSEIVTYARKLHFAVRLLTSGVLIDTEKVKEIANWHPELVAFSVYDLNPSIHDFITRKEGSFTKTMSVIQALKESGVPLKISSVIMDCNFDGYRRVYNFAKKLGAQFQADYRITPKINGSKEPLKFHIKWKNVERLLSDPIFSGKYEPEQTSAEEYSGIFNTIPCGAGHMSCYITPSGVVTPCVQIPTGCDNLKEKTFIDVWKNSPTLENFRSVRFADIPKCMTCNFLSYCRPCPGLNLVENGSIAIPSPRACREAEYMKTLNRRRR